MPKLLTLCFIADATNIHVQRWLGYFVAHGHRVYCLSDKGGAIDGVTVHALPNRDSLIEAGRGKVSKTAVIKARARKIREHLKDIQPDVLHAIFLYHRGWSAALAGFHPIVITLLGSDIYLPQRNYRHLPQLWRDHLVNALAMRQSDLVTAVSYDLHQTAQRMLLGLTPVELIPIGTDVNTFRPDVETTALREKLAIPEEAFVVLSPRQMTPHYNQTTIIESIPRVLEEVPTALFIMKDTFCNTPERQAYVQSLKTLADTLGVSQAIRWVEEVPFTELPQYYALCDVVVSVPSTDGMPVTLFEAMACQKPVIVGDLSSYNEVIIHGQTGLRVPIRNSQVLARSIIKIHKNPALASRLVEESQVILHQYGIFQEQMMRMERYYYGLVNGELQRPGYFRKLLSRWMFQWVVQLT
ncbi:glycosyltransferase [Vampirovibrio chlorellavorus]|uniref:glycosyltransferase n=1 Tax=Vampirovibrio chlorellavorus TaxID=758823 RepID=UPI0026EF3F69|nr:glycosyltransferase [Vampirovibrio chlorellavorus]